MKRTPIPIILVIVIPGIIIVLRTIMHTSTKLRKVESVELELNDTLPYKWQGRNAALKPILSRWVG